MEFGWNMLPGKKNNCHRQMKPTPVIPVSSRREGLALNLQLCRTSSEVCSVQFPYHGNICNIRKQLWDFSSNRDWQRCWRFCMAALSWHQLSVSAGSWKHQFAKAPANAAEWNSHPETCQELPQPFVVWCIDASGYCVHSSIKIIQHPELDVAVSPEGFAHSTESHPFRTTSLMIAEYSWHCRRVQIVISSGWWFQHTRKK